MSFQNCKIKSVDADSSVYHSQAARRGSPEFIVSPSTLKAFMGCHSRYVAGYEPPDTEAKKWGSLLDVLLLTPSQFDSRYSVKPDTYKNEKDEEKSWNGNSNVCKAWRAENKDREIVSRNDIFEVQAAITRLRADETIASFLDASKKQVHVIGEWRDKATGLIIPVQCLIDFVPESDSEFQKCLGDLKTTRNAAQRPFARWCYTAGYHLQAAFDLALYKAATNEDRTDWVFILSENYPPYETGRRLLSQDFIEIGNQTYQHALSKYAKCLKTGIWSGYDPAEEFSLVQAEPFMEFAALEDALEQEQQSTLEQNFDVPMP